ncbi:MAG: dephospho-CoA kinase [Bdellovibrionota bacterium]
MLIVGLTGGIACGKSTVAGMFESLGARVLDADQVARDIVRPGLPAHEEIKTTFGPGVIAPDGAIDRTALGKIIFADPAARARLNAITHPRIAQESARKLNELRESGTQVALYEAALLVETGSYRLYGGLIVVTARPEIQVERLMKRDGITREAALEKITSQMPMEKKTAVADWIIDNSGTPNATRPQVEKVWLELKKRAEKN